MTTGSMAVDTPELVQEVLADEAPAGGHEKRLERYAKAKARQALVVDYIEQHPDASVKKRLDSEFKALLNCGSFLLFRHYYTLDQYKLIQGCTCKKHLLCALCAIRRAAKCIAIYSEKINHVNEVSPVEFDELMITFTVKNGEDLGERFDHLIDSMKKLLQKRRDALKAKAQTDTPMKCLDGAVYSYEVTYTPDKGYHPHVHMIALVPSGVLQFDRVSIKGKSVDVPLAFRHGLIEDWRKITQDSFVIDVRRIESTKTPLEGVDISGSRLEALVEVFKYALKMNQINKDESAGSADNVRIQLDAYEVLRGRRLIGSFGNLWGVKIPENLNDEPLTDEELPYVDLLYQYSGVTFGYQEISRTEGRSEPSDLKRELADQKAFMAKQRTKDLILDSVSR